MPFLSLDSNPYHYSNRATKINDFLSGEREDQDDDKNSSWHLLKINRESSYLSVRGREGARDMEGKTEMQRCINKKRKRETVEWGRLFYTV